jgi:hypothetical protein
VTFEPITTREFKIEVKLKPGFSGGILKWRVASPGSAFGSPAERCGGKNS